MSVAAADSSPPGVHPPWTVEGHSDPHRWFLTMLRDRPIAYDPEGEIWHVFRHRDVLDFCRRPEDWSTAKRMELIPPEQRVMRLLTTDPPAHQVLRNYFSRAYRPRRIEAMEPRIRAVCQRLLEEGMARRRFDVIADLAHPLAVTMISELIGVPEDEQDRFEVSFAILGELKRAEDPESRPVLYMGAADEDEQRTVREYFEQLVARRRAQPRDDLVSDLAQISDIEGEGELDVGALLNEQLGAGQNTSVHLIGNMISLLLEHPEQLARVREDPELIRSAVEECLRFASPLQARPRVSARPLELHGVKIPEGARGLAWIQAANLDTDAFPNPERFDVGRSPNHHVSFGYGEHFCLGAWLARMTARVVLEEWIASIGECAPAEAGPLELVPDFILRGPARLLVDVERRGAPL